MEAQKLTPNRKVMASGIAGALATIVVGILEMNKILLPADMVAAITTLIMFCVAYMIPEKADEIL